MKSNPALPGSHAMVLYSEMTDDMESQSTSYYVRIKIFDEAGLKYANVDASYPHGAHTVEDVSARTIHPDGSIVLFSGQPADRLERNISGSSMVKAFTCPDATPGSIVEYRYKVRFHSQPVTRRMGLWAGSWSFAPLWFSPVWRFDWPVQGELFVRDARYMLRPWVLYAGNVAGTFGIRPTGSSHYRTENLPPDTTLTTEKSGTLECESRNVAPAPKEAYPPPEYEQEAHIEMSVLQGKNETKHEYWARYAGSVQSAQHWELESLKLARRIAAELVEKGDTPQAALSKLYARAQQIRNWTYEYPPGEREGDNEPIPANRTAEDVLKRGEGSASEINLVFLALARAAGFDAELLRLAPRNREAFDIERLDSGQLTTTAVWVRVGDGEVVVDPGTPFCPIGMLPWPKAGAGGFRVDKSGIAGYTTPSPVMKASGIERKANLALSPDGWLRGTVQVEFYGQEALELRLEGVGMNVQERAKTLTERFRQWLPSGSKVESVTATGWDTERGPLHAQFGVLVPPRPGAGGSVTAALTATVAGQPNSFENPERVHAVCFPYPYQELDEITITLPEGMEAGPLPPLREARMELPGEIISAPENGESTGLRRRQPGEVPVAAYQNLQENGKRSITVVRRLLVNLTDVPVAQYAKLREFFQQVHAGDSETVAVSAGTK
jgi:transglutaminase-like putative cysteine protease